KSRRETAMLHPGWATLHLNSRRRRGPAVCGVLQKSYADTNTGGETARITPYVSGTMPQPPRWLLGDRSDGGGRNWTSRDELLSSQVDAQVEALQTVRAEQHHIVGRGEHHHCGGRAASGINQRKTDFAIQYPTVGCFEPVYANRSDTEICQSLG